MNSTTSHVSPWLRTHWFFAVAAAILAADMTLVTTDNWQAPRLLEAGVLIDFAIVLPLLYYWCYRAKGRVAILRAAGLSCLGIWLAGYAVPTEHHYFLDSLSVLRYVGLGVLFLLELKLMLLIYRAMFRGDHGAIEQTIGQAGLPPWVARIVVLEGRFWRWVWGAVKRAFGKK